METEKKPVIPSKSKVYSVQFGPTTILENEPDLEKCISFAYQLHQATAKTHHRIGVYDDIHEMAVFYSANYWDPEFWTDGE